MKTLLTAILVTMTVVEGGYAQSINWRSMGEDQRNVVQLNAGYDFAATVRLGYGRTFTLVRPVMMGIDFSLPMGNDLTDDFKVQLGGEVEILQMDGFSATIKIFSNFRRFENQLVRILSFGADLGALAGYYQSTWYVAGELGFDKAIATHLKHSDIMKVDFPGVRDGWYVPTGGHWYYGIQGGKTIGEIFDLSLRLGAMNAQFNDEDAVVPYYFQLGLGVRF